jgi:hypothetical protein
VSQCDGGPTSRRRAPVEVHGGGAGARGRGSWRARVRCRNRRSPAVVRPLRLCTRRWDETLTGGASQLSGEVEMGLDRRRLVVVGRPKTEARLASRLVAERPSPFPSPKTVGIAVRRKKSCVVYKNDLKKRTKSILLSRMAYVEITSKLIFGSPFSDNQIQYNLRVMLSQQNSLSPSVHVSKTGFD